VDILTLITSGPVSYLFNILLAIVAYFAKLKIASVDKKVADLEGKLDNYHRENCDAFHVINNKLMEANMSLMQNKFEASKTYVEKAEYISTMNKFENRLEKMSANLETKIDSIAEQLVSVIKKS
jgi:hypothetical protein